MKLIILTTEPFPVGMAATNRILSYSKGIVELGHTVEVIALRPTEKESREIRNPNVKSQYNGIKYEYSAGTTIWPDSGKKKFRKVYYIMKGLVNSVKIIKKADTSEKVDALLLYSNSFIHIVFFFFVSSLLNIPYLHEKSEYPSVLHKRTKGGKRFANYYVNHIYKVFDAMIIETATLIKYYKPKLRRKAKILRVPMTVDPQRFDNINTLKPELNNSITYCGNLRDADGITILIKAFQIVSSRYKKIKLTLIGDIDNNPDYNSYLELINKFGLNNKVIFKGRIGRDEVPIFIFNSAVLVLASPNSPRSNGSMPSKLGEYLATGKPVVITKVGEIPDYLKDGESAYLAEPDSVESFAEKLEEVFADPDKAKIVGQNGKKVALQHFNYLHQAKRMIEFFESL